MPDVIDLTDRPATELLEIEITPEMIECVKVELWGFDYDKGDSDAVARRVIKCVLANLAQSLS